MITLFTWLPTTPANLIEGGIMPDMGHSAMQVDHEDGNSTYVSFWPELDGFIGRLTHPAKPRTVRNPVSYAIESDHAQPYMQRPSDFSDTIDTLDEVRVAAGWESVQDLPYDMKRWNCSSVTRLLILTSMEASLLGTVLKASYFDTQNREAAQLAEALLEDAATRLFNSTPMDVRRLLTALGAVCTGEPSTAGTDAGTAPNPASP